MEDNVSIIGRTALAVISLCVLSFVVKFRLSNRSGNQFFIIMTIFWLAVLSISIRPEIIGPVLNDIGLVNRAQFLLVISMGIILYLLYQQSVRNQIFSTRYHRLVRQTAIEQFSNEASGPAKRPTEIAIVVIAKDEEKTVGGVIDRIHSLNLADPYVIILVNDGSRDNTASVARQKNALVVSHLFNLGIGGATKTGFLASKLFSPSYVVSIDSDEQHDPKYIPDMISLLKDGDADLVYASRFHSDSDYSTTGVRLAGNKFYTDLVNRLGNLSITDVTSGYRAIKFQKIPSVFFLSETNFAIELALRAGRSRLSVAEIPTAALGREHGASQFHRIEKFFTYNLKAMSQILNAVFRKADFEA